MTANLWEWNWNSIAKRVHDRARPGRLRRRPGRPAAGLSQADLARQRQRHGAAPWWEVYQPVRYDLTSRMGNEQQFKEMVDLPQAGSRSTSTP